MKYALALLAALATASLGFAQVPVEVAKDQSVLLKSANPKLAANKKLVYDYWRDVIQAGDLTKSAEYMSTDFKEYNPTVPGVGLKGFQDHFKEIFKSPKPVKPTVDNLVDIVAENDLVVLVLREELDDPGQPGKKYTTTWFDMFQVTNGKISAHWDFGTKK